MITLRLESDLPLTDQVVHGIRSAIAGGAVKPGDELPPVRQLAADLGINLNTVARAYRALESLGLVVTARGRGTRVTDDRESRPERQAARTRRVRASVKAALTDARLAGLDRTAAERMFRREFDALWPSGKE